MLRDLDIIGREFWGLNDALKVFADECAELINERRLVIEDLTKAEFASLELFKKALSSFQAVLLLCKEDLQQEAAIILRHLLNVFIGFARVNTPAEGKPLDYWPNRYLQWEWVAEFDELQKIKGGKAEEIASLLSRELEIVGSYEKVKHLYVNEKGRRSKYWYGNSIRNCARDLELIRSYENAYQILSSLEHADYFAISRLNESNRFRLFCVEILKLNFSYFRVVVKFIADNFQLLDTRLLEELFQRGNKLEESFTNVRDKLKV